MKRPRIERRVIDVVETEVVQTHLLETVFRGNTRGTLLCLPRGKRTRSLLLPRVYDTEQRLLLPEKEGIWKDSFLQFHHEFDVFPLGCPFQQLRYTPWVTPTFPANTTGVRGESINESGNESIADARDCDDASADASTGKKRPIPGGSIGTGKKGRQRGRGKTAEWTLACMGGNPGRYMTGDAVGGKMNPPHE